MLGFGWDGADEQKLMSSFGMGRSRCEDGGVLCVCGGCTGALTYMHVDKRICVHARPRACARICFRLCVQDCICTNMCFLFMFLLTIRPTIPPPRNACSFANFVDLQAVAKELSFPGSMGLSRVTKQVGATWVGLLLRGCKLGISPTILCWKPAIPCHLLIPQI